MVSGEKSLLPYEIAENKSNEMLHRFLQFPLECGIKKNLKY
jgi:hypothetical protein